MPYFFRCNSTGEDGSIFVFGVHMSEQGNELMRIPVESVQLGSNTQLVLRQDYDARLRAVEELEKMVEDLKSEMDFALHRKDQVFIFIIVFLEFDSNREINILYLSPLLF